MDRQTADPKYSSLLSDSPRFRDAVRTIVGMRKPPRCSGRRVAAITAGSVIVVLVAGQWAIPAVAERVARDQIGTSQAHVEIRAFPAWKLLFGRLDRLRVQTPTLDVDPAELTSLLRRARHVREGTVVVGELTLDGLRLRGIEATLDDGDVTARADLSIAELAEKVPGNGTLTPEPPQADGLPRLRASLSLLGVRTGVPVVVRASNGVLEAAGDAGIASAVRITVFRNDALYVDDVRGTVDGDTLRVTFRGHLQ